MRGMIARASPPLSYHFSREQHAGREDGTQEFVGAEEDGSVKFRVTDGANEGRSGRKIVRSLKRYVARELYRCLPVSSTLDD